MALLKIFEIPTQILLGPKIWNRVFGTKNKSGWCSRNPQPSAARRLAGVLLVLFECGENVTRQRYGRTLILDLAKSDRLFKKWSPFKKWSHYVFFVCVTLKIYERHFFLVTLKIHECHNQNKFKFPNKKFTKTQTKINMPLCSSCGWGRSNPSKQLTWIDSKFQDLTAEGWGSKFKEVNKSPGNG